MTTSATCGIYCIISYVYKVISYATPRFTCVPRPSSHTQVRPSMPAVVDGGVRDALTGSVLLRDAVLGLHVELVVPDEDVVGLLRAAPWLRRREKRSVTYKMSRQDKGVRPQAGMCVCSSLSPLATS